MEGSRSKSSPDLKLSLLPFSCCHILQVLRHKTEIRQGREEVSFTPAWAKGEGEEQ